MFEKARLSATYKGDYYYPSESDIEGLRNFFNDSNYAYFIWKRYRNKTLNRIYNNSW